ncbi:MAG TPA: FkbM family methyltransferase, partial [Chromatiales bacterium]|nr:FkbM family methyltransferase [Chromatiales bacterium]
EIRFLRRAILPGQRVIDIGANYGTYALSLARTVGPRGRIWAFEPASSTAALLAESIAINDFEHVVLEQSALSAQSGTAKLALHGNAELNALTRSESPAGRTESVQVITLDKYIAARDVAAVDFIKIDAEGQELNILHGGHHFFGTQSPLVQFEIKTDSGPSLELARALTELDYGIYRLAPGPGILIPFELTETIDNYLLNLFACKPERANALAEQGLLVENIPVAGGWDESADWENVLAGLPYGRILADQWRKVPEDDAEREEVEQALALYAVSRNTSLPPAERIAALETGYQELHELTRTAPARLRLASLARMASDYGARKTAVDALRQLCASIAGNRNTDLSEPFLIPEPRYEGLEPGPDLDHWVFIAILEALERLHAFSSYYTGQDARARLELICASGFASAEMHRRLDLVNRRFQPGQNSSKSINGPR